MPGLISGPCGKCGYDLKGVPLDELGLCICPECGDRQSGRASTRPALPPYGMHIVLAAIPSLLMPIWVGIVGADGWGYDRWGPVVFGFVVSPFVGGAAGFVYGVIVSGHRNRHFYNVPVARERWSCAVVGFLAGLAAMIASAVVLRYWPDGQHGWNC
jgi:hypothetical protein